MEERIWDKFLTERDKQVFDIGASGYGARQGFGKRPAILVIDVNWAFCGEKPEPILESMKTWRNSCGEESWPAIAATKEILDAARAKGVPVIYTTGIRRADTWDSGSWTWKNSRHKEDKTHGKTSARNGNEIVDVIAPQPKDIVVCKQKPSGFFGTNLASYLTLLGCDSIIAMGTTTSGCVRATVLDAFSLNYRVTVVEDCTFDRAQASHALNLFDMNAKYADVLHSREIHKFIDTLEAGMFDLPSGGL